MATLREVLELEIARHRRAPSPPMTPPTTPPFSDCEEILEGVEQGSAAAADDYDMGSEL